MGIYVLSFEKLTITFVVRILCPAQGLWQISTRTNRLMTAAQASPKSDQSSDDHLVAWYVPGLLRSSISCGRIDTR